MNLQAAVKARRHPSCGMQLHAEVKGSDRGEAANYYTAKNSTVVEGETIGHVDSLEGLYILGSGMSAPSRSSCA